MWLWHLQPTRRTGPAHLLFLALLPSAAGLACPRISDLTLAGAPGAGEPVLLSDIEFPVTVTYQWVDELGLVDACPGRPQGATVMSGLNVSVEGAELLSLDVPENASTMSLLVRFPEGGASTTFVVRLSDPSGDCGGTSMELERYVYWKHMPLVPLVVVLIICPVTRDVFFSLGIGGLLGWMILERHPWFGFLRYFDTGLPDTISGGFRDIMLFLFLMGAVVGATVRSGGVQGLGDVTVRFVKDSFLGQAVVYILGWVIFLDDYATTVIVGTTLRGVTDKMRVSREKLSFIVDCTAAPIAGVMPLSTWIAHELLVLQTALADAGYTKEAPYTIFLQSIPKRFYSWFMLIFVANNFIMGRDWGFMYWAEMRVRRFGIQSSCADGEETVDSTFTLVKKERVPARWWNAFVPYFSLLILFVAMLLYSGATGGLREGGGVGWGAGAKDIVGNADSWAVLKWVAGMVLVLQLFLYAVQYNKKEWGGCILFPREFVMAGIDGSKEYFVGALAILLAFTFAEALKDLQIAQYLVQNLSDSLSEAELPALTFLLCAIFSLATGTSWGTMLVFMPVCMPLATSIGGVDNTELVTSVAASVLGGSVWGDHCSPVSDTTILAAAAASCPLIDHAKTQLPYALFCGCYAIAMGFLPVGAGAPAGVMILVAFIAIPLLHFTLSLLPGFGGLVPIYNPDVGATTGQGFAGAIESLRSIRNSRRPPPQQQQQQHRDVPLEDVEGQPWARIRAEREALENGTDEKAGQEGAPSPLGPESLSVEFVGSEVQEMQQEEFLKEPTEVSDWTDPGSATGGRRIRVGLCMALTDWRGWPRAPGA